MSSDSIPTLDLNLDAGESLESFQSGLEESLYQMASSVNIACGGHFGDSATMGQAVRLARKHQVSVGAHPSFPDRKNFGRKAMNLSFSELRKSLVEQIQDLKNICLQAGVPLVHVKPHGALYNLAAKDEMHARALLEAVQCVDPSLCLVALAGSPFLNWCREYSLQCRSEAFCDRRYEKDGSLRSRDWPDAVIVDPDEAALQAVSLATKHSVLSWDGEKIEVRAQTLCLHGDSPNAWVMARRVRHALEYSGIKIKSLN